MTDKVSEDIGFDEWSVRVDEGNSGEYSSVQDDGDTSTANSWLPAYGFHQTSTYIQDKQLDFYASENAVDSACGSHLLLETIMEETSDDLRSETSGSEHTSGLQTDSPASTVIHVPIHNGLTDKKSLSWNGLEINNDPGVQDDDEISDDTDDDDEDDDTESTSSDDNGPFPSRSSSLLQFEHLEKHYENVFRTQRTSSDPLRVGSSSFDKLEEKFGRRRWNYVRSSQPDTLDRDIDDDNVEEEEDDSSSMSSSCSSSSVISSDDIMSSSYCSMRTDSFSNRTHVKSLSRSIDSLTCIHQKQEKMDLTRSAEMSQSLNDGLCKDEDDSNEIPTTGNLYRTVDCLSEIPVEIKNKSTDEDDEKVSKCNRTRSMENLSEDSGFGDHMLCVGSPSSGNLVKKVNEILNTTPAIDEVTHGDINTQIYVIEEDVKEERDRYIDSIYRTTTDSIWQSDPNLLETRLEVTQQQFKPSSSSSKLCVSYDQVELDDTIDIDMASRFSVVSTPNLYKKDEEYHYRGSEEDNIIKSTNNDSAISLPRAISLKRINFGSENILSTASSKGSNIQITTSFVNLTNPLGSNRGVHFCPVVSEVSWQEHYSSSSEEEMESSKSDDSCEENEYEDLEDNNIIKETEMFLKSEIAANERERCEVTLIDERDRCPSGTPIDELVERLLSDTPKEKQAAYDKEKEKYLQRNRLDLITSPPPDHNRGVAHVTNKPHNITGNDEQVNNRSNQSSSRCVVVNNMDKKAEKKSGSKLGEFFQRFSLRRLSGRGRKKDKNKNETKPPVVVSYLKKDEKSLKNCDENFIKTKEEVEEENNKKGELTTTGKPPLPPSMPPRRRPSDQQVELASSSSSYYAQSSQSARAYNTPTMALKSPVIDPRSNSVLLETDIDSNITSNSSSSNNSNNKKSRSLLNLDNVRSSGKQLLPKELNHTSSSSTSHHTPTDYRAKSMEFLLDKDNKAAAKPPENELQKVGVERKMSENEMRVQRSLQKLNVPDWYKNSSVPAQGFLLKRNNEQGSPQSRWNSSVSPPNKTTSLSSLGSTLSSAPRSPTGGVISSPSPTHYTFSRWSTSRLNSGTNSSSTSPCGSARSSFNYRQPYLGWRSQERLSKPRTPAERLAAGIAPQNQAYSSEHSTPSLNDVRCSIKEVTSAIVHYVSKKEEDSGIDRLTSSPRYTSDSKNSSPKGSAGRLCWLESSFVGTRPSDSSVRSPPSYNKQKSKEEFHLNFPSSSSANRTKYNGNEIQDVNGEYMLA